MQLSGRHNVKLSLAELEDDTDVMDILYHFMKTSGLDVGTREGAKAYELDEAVEWVKWGEEVDLAMSALTRHEAPPCCCKHLGTLTAYGDGLAEATT